MPIPGFILQLLLFFVWRQIQKWGSDINWDLVKADAVARIAALLPGDRWDDVAQMLVGEIIDIIKELLESKNLVSPNQQEVEVVFNDAQQLLLRRLAEKAMKRA